MTRRLLLVCTLSAAWLLTGCGPGSPTTPAVVRDDTKPIGPVPEKQTSRIPPQMRR